MSERLSVSSRRSVLKYKAAEQTESWDAGECEIREETWVAAEYPLTVVVNGAEFATLVCTPDHLDELAVGFLASEGVIRAYGDIRELTLDIGKGYVYVELAGPLPVSAESVTKRVIGSCCGKSRQFYFQNDMRTAKTVMGRFAISAGQVLSLMGKLQERSGDFRSTGGVHNAALCSPDDLILLRTDIGRHNTLDKLYGAWLQAPFSLQDKSIVFSGRISSEVLLKCAKIGVGLLISKSAPTDLALDLAEDLGITAAGFVRGSQFNVYTHPERIVF